MRYLVIILLLALVGWGLAFPEIPSDQLFSFWRRQGFLLTGIVGIVFMGALMLMALRPRWLEKRVGGLDHLYWLHKWCGIGAGISVLLHWAILKSSKWLVELGWITLPPRKPREFELLRWLAKEAGEWCFYIMAAFIIISLIRAVPYRRFRQIHKIGAILFLMAAFHSVYFIPDALRWQAFGVIIAIASGIGTIAACLTLPGWVGRQQRSDGSITALNLLPGDVLELTLELTKGLANYQPGQFTFLTLDQKEGPHPYTIVACDAEKKQLTFAIKALGDHTRELPEKLKVGDQIQISPAYGGFQLHPAQGKEYWIAGGIGITPFLAWLDALAIRGEQRQNAELIYCFNSEAEGIFSERLRQLCEKTGVTLRLMNRERDGLLDPASLAADKTTQVWFCGPLGLRKLLKQKFTAKQLHFEQFEFR